MGSFRVFVVLILPLNALAFTLNTPSETQQSWGTAVLNFDYNYDLCPSSMPADAMNSLLDAAFDLWNGVPSSGIQLVRGTSVSLTPSAARSNTTPRNPVIVCDSSFSATTGSSANSIPALTSAPVIDGGNNQILYASILLNSEAGKSASIGSLDPKLVNIIIAHEVGHVLGLGHSADPKALMYYKVSKHTELSLAEDDLNGITFLYPRQELINSKILGCGSVQSSKDQAPPGPSAALEAFSILMTCAITVILMKRRNQGSRTII